MLVERLHRLADAVRHRVEPLGYGARELRLPAGITSPMVCTRPAVSAWMRASLRHALFELLGMHVVARRLHRRVARGRASMTAMAPSSARTTQAKAASASPTRDGRAADHEERLCHGAPCSAIRLAGLNEAENTARERGQRMANRNFPVHIRVQR